MDIAVKTEGESTVFAPSGRLDAASSQDFESQVLGQLTEKECGKVIFDFTSLAYISSAGLRSILTAAKQLKSCGGSLSLCCLSGLVEEVIALSGFDSFLTIHDDLAQAVEAQAAL